jgi:3-deoxy-manno-octulosonate cytidylyltransferase (CMP-KDO synthetase)
MMPPIRPIIMIPSRMNSVRLPNKPMAMIGTEPMIVHVWRRACAAHVAPVVVVCDHEDIAYTITSVGGHAVMTQNHATGSDRLAQGIDLFDPQGQYTHVINVQGDLPHFPSSVLGSILHPFSMPCVDMTTFIQPKDPSVAGAVHVRAQTMLDQDGQSWMQCIDFTRHDWESDYTHLGVYAFRRSVLKQFSQWPQTQREQSESLEQLRMMDRNIFIAGVLLGKETFISVDTPADLQRARAYGV